MISASVGSSPAKARNWCFKGASDTILQIMKVLQIPKMPALVLRLEGEGGSLVQAHLSLPEIEGFHLVFEPAEIAPALVETLVEWLGLYAERKAPAFPLPLDTSPCGPFTQKVLKQLQKVPFGKSTSYAALAAQVKSPKAARAVGNACGANLFPLLIPCHRVLAPGGKLGGFSCGAEIKKRLLAFEKIPYTQGSVP